MTPQQAEQIIQLLTEANQKAEREATEAERYRSEMRQARDVLDERLSVMTELLREIIDAMPDDTASIGGD